MISLTELQQEVREYPNICLSEIETIELLRELAHRKIIKFVDIPKFNNR